MRTPVIQNAEAVGFWTALGLIAILAAFSVREARTLVRTARQVEHTHRVIESLGELRSALRDLEDAKRGYALTGDESRLRRYAPGRLRNLLSSLRAQTADNATQQRSLDRLVPVLDRRIGQLDAAIVSRRATGFEPRREAASIRAGDEIGQTIRAVISFMVAEEQRLLVDRQRRTTSSLEREAAVQFVGILTSALLLLLAFASLRRQIRFRRDCEGRARQSEEDLATTLQSIGDGVISTDQEGRVTRLNSSASRLTGWKATEALGRPLAEVFHIVHEVTREPAVDAIARVLRVGAVVGVANHTVLIARDGTETAIADSAAPIHNVEGAITGAVLVFRDASVERDSSERILRANQFLDSVIENIPDVILVQSAKDLRFERINRAGELLLGRPRAELLGRRYADLFPPDRAEALEARDREALDLPTPAGPAEEILEAPEGLRCLQTQRIPILGDDGAPRYLLRIAQDVTERQRLSEDLREANAELERRVAARTVELVTANVRLEQEVAERRRTALALEQSEEQFRQAQKMEAVGRLAGGIAHDFNNVLSVILGYSEMLAADRAPDDPIRADLEEITQAGRRAADLTRQLLAYSRQQVLAPEIVDLNKVISGLGSMLRRLLGEDVELRTLARPRLGRVRVDPRQMEQVLMNLVINARDAMPRGGTLTIETDNVELDATYAAAHVGSSPGPHVLVAVTDSGTGMDAATRARIFDPFFTTKEHGKGTGLGLSTVFGIVQQSGGSVWVYSEPGEGSTFKVYLPRTDEAASESRRPPPREALLPGTETILLAEDDEQLRDLVRTILQRTGYQVLDAHNGEEALHLCASFSGPIHLLLTDVVMPKLGGRELSERMAVLRPESRALFMSGYTDDAVVRHGVFAADIAFLQKPITPDALARKVRAVLDDPDAP